MNQDESLVEVKKVVEEIFEEHGTQQEVTDDMLLMGGSGALDSIQLVELCLALEDRAEKHGFSFDWTSESAMSRSKGMFRTIRSLADELAQQSAAQR